MSFIFVYLPSLSLLGSVDEFLLSTKEEIKNRCVVTMLSIIFVNEVMMILLILLMMTPSWGCWWYHYNDDNGNVICSVDCMLSITPTGESLNHASYRSCAEVQAKIRWIYIILNLIQMQMLISSHQQWMIVARVAGMCYLPPTSKCFNSISLHRRIVIVGVVEEVVVAVVAIVESTSTHHMTDILMLVRMREETRVCCHQKRNECSRH